MKTRSQTRIGTAALLSLLSLLAFAIGAQAALAASSSNGSAATTPAAGAEGRGGVDGSATVTVISTSPVAGTQDRGGVSLSVATLTPAPGTEGRGGVGAVTSTLAAATAVAAADDRAFVSRGRGGFPAGALALQGPAADSSGWPSAGGWVALGLVAAAAVIAGLLAWAASRRRQSPLATYCARNPSDPLCGAA